jgi:hypothetical protein
MLPRVVFVEHLSTHKREHFERSQIYFVGDLRRLCIHSPEYSDLRNLPDPFFLVIRFGATPLTDDAILFNDLHYPDVFLDSQNPPFFSVYPDRQVSLSIAHRLITFEVKFPASFTIADVRRCLSVRFSAPFPKGTVALGNGRPLEDDQGVGPLYSEGLLVNDPPGYRILHLKVEGEREPFVISERARVFDLIAQRQAARFSQGGTVKEVSIWRLGREVTKGTSIGDITIKDGDALDVREGEDWPPERVEFSYRFKGSPVYRDSVPARASLAFVRALIARRRQVPPDGMDLADGTRSLASSMQQPLGHERALVVAGQDISVHCEGPGSSKVVGVPLFGRVCDLRASFEAHVGMAFRVQLSLRGRLLVDNEPLAEVGIEDGSKVEVDVLPHPLIRLSVRDLEGTSEREIQGSDRSPIILPSSFGMTGSNSAPPTVCRLKFLTVSEETPTFRSIAERLSAHPLAVEFWYDGKQFNATDSLLSQVWDPEEPIIVRPKRLEMTVQFEGTNSITFPITAETTVDDAVAEVRSRCPKIASLDLTFDERGLPPSQRIVTLDLTRPFVARNPRFTRMVTFVCESGRRVSVDFKTCKDIGTARTIIARNIQETNPESVVIMENEKELADEAELRLGASYSFKIMKSATFVLHLAPSQSQSCNRNLSQAVAVSVSQYPTVGAVVDAFCHSPLNRSHVKASFQGRPLAFDTPWGEQFSNQIMNIEHSLPTTGPFRFVSSNGRFLVMDVGHERFVSALKLEVIPGLEGHFALPSTVSFRYFGCDLEDGARFCEYGIPAGSQIDVRMRASEAKSVDFMGVSASWAYSPATDRVADLRTGLCRCKSIPADSVVFTTDGMTVADDRLLRDLNGSVVHAVCRESPRVGFLHNGVLQTVTIDRTAPLKTVVPQIAHQLGITDPFTILCEESEVDDDTTIQDLGPNPNLQIAMEPALTEVAVMVATRGPIGQIRRLQLAPATTLLGVEEYLRGAGALTAQDVVEFTLTDRTTGKVATAGKERTIGSLELDRYDLTVVSAEPLSNDPGKVAYNFIKADTEEEFQMKFGPTQTVLDAKTAIKRRFHQPAVSDVILLFAGKQLKDRLVLDRLRIGEEKVVVYLKKTGPVVLYSMRSR